MKKSVMRLVALVIIAPLCISVRADFLGTAVGGAIGASAASHGDRGSVNIVSGDSGSVVLMLRADLVGFNCWYYESESGYMAINKSSGGGCNRIDTRIERISMHEYLIKRHPDMHSFKTQLIFNNHGRLAQVVVIIYK